MKLHALLIAVALAAGSAAYAQSSVGSGSTADTQGSTAMEGTGSGGHRAKAARAHKTKVVKKHVRQTHRKQAMAHRHERHAMRHHHDRHAMQAMRHHHDRHAMQGMHHHGAQAMGAGPYAPVTDLGARSREDRMAQAYADWRARIGR